MVTADLRPRSALAILLALPALIAACAIWGPFTADALPLFSGMATTVRPGWLPGFGTIDPNMGYTAYALGVRAALDLASGVLPLWNHYEGLGAPLLGEVQSAALFPPTLLLLLPHGQILEQALLQAAAGVGTYLFLRRFGLGPAAALAGGLIFELNGAFAWLRNAIFLPIAFLPWLFLAIETLFAAARDGRWRRLGWPAIVIGAIAAALALTAGFPEVVYFYSLLLLLWAAARALSLPPRRLLGYAGGLAAMALLAALLAAPALIAFAHFLPEAELGGHRDDLFKGAFLPPTALILYWLPYFYGAVVASPNADIRPIWSGIGGYLGLMPLILGVFGLMAARRRPLCWLLAAWAATAIAVSHGAPGLHALFVQLPLVSIAAYSRYLNASWIFCFAVLAAVGLDRWPGLSVRERGWIAAVTLAIVSAIVAAGLVAAGPILAEIWPAKQHQRLYVIVSLAVALALLGAFAAALRSPRARTWLTLCLGAEALAAFTLPLASFPRIDSVDRTLIDFLQRHAGPQRTALASFTGLTPNFGSAFCIPAINYDDLPVPSRTIDYIHAAIDPSASVVNFRPSGEPETADQRERRHHFFVGHLPGYARAGVRYVIGDPDLFAIPAYPLAGSPTPIALAPGQSLQATLDAPGAGRPIRGALLRIGTYGGTADGQLRLRLCQAGTCAEGDLDLAAAADNRVATIDLPDPLTLRAAPTTLTIEHRGGNHLVALWGQDAQVGEPRKLPELAFLRFDDPAPVFANAAATVFDLPNFRPYAAADGCTIGLLSQDRLTAQCDRASVLVRLEVFMTGWQARVNGAAAQVRPIEDTFQAIDLPQGRSTIEFAFAPAGLRPSIAVAAATLLALLLSLIRTRRQDDPPPAKNDR